MQSQLELSPLDVTWNPRAHCCIRAAIREYDGGMAREHAEAAALQDVLAELARLGLGR